MRLTDKQLEIMDVFWESNVPMTIADIIEASCNKSWSNNSIYKLIEQLLIKGVVIVAHASAGSANYAKAYTAAISLDEFMVKHIAEINKDRKHSIRLSFTAIVDAMMQLKDEWEDE